MPRFIRRRYGGRRWYNRYWKRRWYKRGVNRSNKDGTRRFKLTVPTYGRFSVTVNQGQTLSDACSFVPFVSNVPNNYPGRCMGNLFQGSFNAYCRLYDEVKVDWMSVNINLMTPVGGQTDSVTVFTSVDRRCSYAELNDNVAAPNNTYWSATEVIQSAGVQMQPFNTVTRKNIYRTVKANDLIERVQFIDSDYTVNQAGNFGNSAFVAAGANPNFFCPAVYMCLQMPAPAAANTTFQFAYTVKYGVTFRGPKYSQLAAAVRGVSDGDDIVEIKRVETEKAGKKDEEKKEVSKEEMEDLMEKLKKLGLVGDDDTVLLDDMKDSDDKS